MVVDLSPEARALLSMLKRQADGREVPQSLAIACAELHEHELIQRSNGRVLITQKGLTMLKGIGRRP